MENTGEAMRKDHAVHTDMVFPEPTRVGCGCIAGHVQTQFPGTTAAGDASQS